MNTSQAQPHDAAPSRSSIVAHPWFPKLIGLWCAALFGLCSLALAPEMLERIVATLGIDRIVSAAAPPLGQTARLLLALGMAGVGEIVGLVIGRRVATSRFPRPARQRGLKSASIETTESEAAPHLRGRDRHPDAPARKPLSASSDLGDETGRELGGIDIALRRRALASEAEQEPRPFIEVAPLPGGDWQSAAVDGIEQPEVKVEPGNQFVAEQSETAEAFDLGQFDAPSDDQPEAQCAPAAAPVAAPPRTFVSAFLADAATMPTITRAEPKPEVPAAIAAANLDQLGVVQLSERLALALQARRERRARAPVPSLPVAALTLAPVAVEVLDMAEHVAGAPVEVLTLDEPLLAEPIATQESYAALPLPIAFTPPPFAAPPLFAPLAQAADEEAADQDEHIPALARSLAMPRMSGPHFAEPEPEPEPEPVAPALQRGLEILARRAPKPTFEHDAVAKEADAPQVVVPRGAQIEDPEELSDDTLEAGYSSLLAMGSGFQRPEAVRIEEPTSDEIEPVVIFPGQRAHDAGPAERQIGSSPNAPYARPSLARSIAEAPATAEPGNQASPEETDRALRAALASLQRISGAR